MILCLEKKGLLQTHRLMGTLFLSKGSENPGLGFGDGTAPVQELGIFTQVDLSDIPELGDPSRGG